MVHEVLDKPWVLDIDANVKLLDGRQDGVKVGCYWGAPALPLIRDCAPVGLVPTVPFMAVAYRSLTARAGDWVTGSPYTGRGASGQVITVGRRRRAAQNAIRWRNEAFSASASTPSRSAC